MLLRPFRVALTSMLVGMMIMVNGCAPIQLVSKYDDSIDKQAQQLQKKLDSYFISLQNGSNENLKYKSQQKFYEGVLSDLDAMEVRANGIYKNQLTIEQINLAKMNLAYLVLLNKQCITKPLTDQQKKDVEKNGIDLSMDCKVSNGATENIAKRGDMPLNRFAVAPLQDLFNQHLGAIMALELAKKRGETK
jgi:hypothetical protein